MRSNDAHVLHWNMVFIKFIELGPWGDTSPYEMKTNKQQEGKIKTFIK